MNKKQTALQWYRQQVMAVLSTHESETRHMTEGQIFARALEMEREQHNKTYYKGFSRIISGSQFITFTEYFNETYGKEQNNDQPAKESR